MEAFGERTAGPLPRRSPMTQGSPTTPERLARIETILERIEAKVDQIDIDQRKDIADLAALKNKGWGVIAGVALAAGGAGAFLRDLLG